MSQFVIRNARTSDVPQILSAAKHLDSVNLPARQDHIERIVEMSVASFRDDIPPFDREYVFVLEEQPTKQVIGTSMIHAQHGTRRSPHVYLEVIDEERYSETLDRYMVHQALQIRYNYDGPTEIGGLILLPEYRGNPSMLGKLLSYTRFLFIAMHRSLFRDEVISELLPPLEPDGTSKLWEHFGGRFTGLDYRAADVLSKDNKEFIRALFPHGLIYTSLFPTEVHDVIGQVGAQTKGVEKMLRRIGFDYAKQIDPFDGGPHFKARTDDITLVKEAKTADILPRKVDDDAPWGIVAIRKQEEFIAVGTKMEQRGAELWVEPQVAKDLGVRSGDEVWFVIPAP